MDDAWNMMDLHLRHPRSTQEQIMRLRMGSKNHKHTPHLGLSRFSTNGHTHQSPQPSPWAPCQP